MLNENITDEMIVEKLQLKVEEQQKIISELTRENEQLYHQYNHLMVRNNKYLKRIDDMQQIIEALHQRMGKSPSFSDSPTTSATENLVVNNDYKGAFDTLNRRIDELHLRNDILHQRAAIFNKYDDGRGVSHANEDNALKSKVDIKSLFEKWKNFPGQDARNAPNMLKQMKMLAILYESKSMNASDLFQRTGVNGVTGARYVSILKHFELIQYIGARKKGQYSMTPKGIELVESEALVTVEDSAAEPAPITVTPDLTAIRIPKAIENPDL